MDASPPIFFLPFSIEMDVQISPEGGDGVMVAAGSRFGGWSFYLQDGKPVGYAAVSPLQGRQYQVSADKPLSSGSHLVRYEFTPSKGGGGSLSILVDGEKVAEGKLAEVPHVMAGSGETFDIGRDSRGPVSMDYKREGVFNGKINKIEVRLEMPDAGG